MDGDGGLLNGLGTGEGHVEAQAAANTEAGQAPAAGQPAAQVPEDGNWIPEEYRNDPGITKFKSVGDLIKSTKNLETLIGKKTIGMPDEHSSAEDWNTFYKNCGRPDTAEGYKITRADGLPDEVKNDPGVKGILETAHKLGVSQKQMEGLFAEYDRQIGAALQRVEEQRNSEKAEVVATLKQMYGSELQSVAERAEATLKILDPDGKIDRSKLANRVEVIQLLDAVGKSVLGDRLPHGDTSGGPLGNIEDQIRTIQNNPAFTDPLNADHDRLVKQHNMLQAQRYSLRQGK